MIESHVGFTVIMGKQVPHRRTTINGITFDAPARIKPLATKGSPVFEHDTWLGMKLYALPGGGTITECGRVL